ncbi:MAG: Acetate kinase [Lentisphaerae bacterium ADurb.Bin242]|nr:MAG: Acetate kinase [Lentisphaerae bacterium ADurb.Bin242]
MNVLVINAGSSSLKFTLFSMVNGSEKIIASGQVERVGSDTPNLIYKLPEGFKVEESPRVANHADALKAVCEKLVDPEHGVLKSLSEVTAIGHRVLHGGEKITMPVRINREVKDIIRECFPLGPLHNPANLMGIEACEEIFKDVPNVGVFDTQFHQTMPPEAYLYAIPYDYYRKYGIRKYGFHGTSHHFVTNSTAEFLGKKVEDITIITCHLGNGCSMAAVKNGKVIDTTMGLTPLEGLMMGTRSGDLDPAAVIRMIQLGNTPAEVDNILNKKSGLLGIGGINSGDMRDIINAAEAGREQAALALKMFIRRVVKYIGAYYVLLDGPEALVFTGGIGEYSKPVRKMIVEGLGSLNLHLDPDGNEEFFGKKGIISTQDSAWKAIVMPTNEELMIARSTLRVLGVK